MSVLKVTTVTDIAGLGGFTLSSGSITCNGTLRVNNININGSITGLSEFNIPSFSGQSGKVNYTDYKKSFTQNTIINPNMPIRDQNFNNLDELQRHRSNIS